MAQICVTAAGSDVIAKMLNYSSPKSDSRMPSESTQPKREKFREEDRGQFHVFSS